MIEVIVNSNNVIMKVTGSAGEAKASAEVIRACINVEDRTYLAPNSWVIKNPWKYSGNIPALANALEDAQRQMSWLSAIDVANMKDQKYAQFFFYLTNEEQLIILECALQALRDEMSDGFMREARLLDLDVSDEALDPILEKLSELMRG
jgi:hypothetical protein